MRRAAPTARPAPSDPGPTASRAAGPEHRRPWYRRADILFGLLAVFAMGIGLRAAYLQQYVGESPFLHAPAGEARTARDLAVEVSHGYVSGPEFLSFSPLYPLALGGVYRWVGESTGRVITLQAVLGLAMLWLVFWLGMRLASPSVGVLAAGLVALYGPLLHHESRLLPVTLVTLLNVSAVAVGTWALGRHRPAWCLLAGLVLGALVWARPWMLLFPLLLGAAGLVALRGRTPAERLRGVTRAAFLTAGLVLALTPLLIRNAASGAPATLFPADLGLRVYAGNHAGAAGDDRAPPGFTAPRSERFHEARFHAKVDLERENLSPRQVTRHYLGLAGSWWASDPAGAAVGTLRKAYRFVQRHEPGGSYSYARDRALYPALAWAVVPFSALLILGLAGLMLWRFPGRLWIGMNLAAHAAYGLLIFVSSEARSPVVPLLAIPAALALLGAAHRLTRTWQLASAALILAAGTAALWPNLLDGASALRAERMEQEGRALRSQGRRWAARGRFQKAVEAAPSRPSAQHALALADLSVGQVQDAVSRLQQVLRRNPRRAALHVTLARVSHQRAGHAAARNDRGASADWIHRAHAHAQQALQSAPRSVSALLLYARIRREMGRLQESEQLLRRAHRIAPHHGRVLVERGINAAIRQQLTLAESYFTFARLLGATPDPVWVQALRDARRARRRVPGR
jgi:Tfp pilus assembly protein PilF